MVLYAYLLDAESVNSPCMSLKPHNLAVASKARLKSSEEQLVNRHAGKLNGCKVVASYLVKDEFTQSISDHLQEV